MREARVECVCQQYRLDDLGLAFTLGQVRFFTESQLKASKELQHAIRAGALSVRWQERCRVKKEERGPIPPFLRPKVRKNRNVATKRQEPSEMDEKTASALATKAATAAVDMLRKENEETARQVAAQTAAAAKKAAKQASAQAAAAAKSAAEEAVKLVMASQGASIAAAIQQAVDPSQEGGLTQEALEGAVAKALSQMVTKGKSLTPAEPSSTAAPVAAAAPVEEEDSGPDEPVFIPEDLTAESGKKLTTTTTESSSSGGIDAAAAALKMMQGGGSSRRRKKTDE